MSAHPESGVAADRATRAIRSTWAALALVVVYVLLAAGLGNLLGGPADNDSPLAEFALSHFIPLAVAIVVLVLFIRRAGWGAAIWRERPTPTLTPRRRWLVSIPVLAVLSPISQLGDVPWADRGAWFLAVVAAGVLMVGFGEELLVRGVLLTAVRARHGEFVTLLVTAVVFALAHIPGSVIAGVSPAVILFQVAALASTGVTYYWVRRVTGRLWVGVLVHAFTDWTLYLASGAGTPTAGLTQSTTTGLGGSILTAIVGGLLLLAAALSVVSVIREDHRNRRTASEVDVTASEQGNT